MSFVDRGGAAGISILYISHRLKEVETIADRVTVAPRTAAMRADLAVARERLRMRPSFD